MLLRKVHNVVCACEVPTEVRRNINRVCSTNYGYARMWGSCMHIAGDKYTL